MKNDIKKLLGTTLCGSLLAFGLSSQATIITWNGDGGNTSWSNGDNWDLNRRQMTTL